MKKQLVVVESVRERVESAFEYGPVEPLWVLTLFSRIFLVKMWCNRSRCNVYTVSRFKKNGEVSTINLTTIFFGILCAAVMIGMIIASAYLGC